MKNNQSKVSLAVFAWCLCVCGFQLEVFSQAPGTTAPQVTPAATPSATPAPAGGVAIEFSREAGIGVGVDSLNAQKMAEAFVSEKGWSLDSEKDGIWTVVKSASLPVGPDNPKFQLGREQAFEEALLKAKMALAEFLRAQISTTLESTIKKGDPSKVLNPEPPLPGKSPTLLDKAKSILHDEVDRELAKRNILPKSPEAAKEIKAIIDDVLQGKDFKSSVTVQALAELSALQSYRTFESCVEGKAGKPGQVAVVAIHSDKSAQLHQALLGIGEAPRGEVAETIRKWAQNQGPHVLLYTQGAQPRRDDSGDVVLVAFGQAVGVSDSDLSVEIALEEADTAAQKALRRFMGEFIAVNKKSEQSSSLKEMASGAQEFKALDTYNRAVQAAGKDLLMPGAKQVYTWNKPHPSSGQMVYGSVYVYSVAQARKANAMYFDFKRAGGAAGGAGSSAISPAVKSSEKEKANKSDKQQDSAGKGAEGDNNP